MITIVQLLRQVMDARTRKEFCNALTELRQEREQVHQYFMSDWLPLERYFAQYNFADVRTLFNAANNRLDWYVRVALVSLRLLKPKFHLARHVTSGHDTFDVSSPCILAVLSLWNSMARHARRRLHFGCVELVEQHRSSRRARHVERVVSCRDVTSLVEFGLLSCEILSHISCERFSDFMSC